MTDHAAHNRAGSSAHREDAHDFGEAGGLPVARCPGEVGKVLGRDLLEGLALRKAQLLHDEPVVARLGKEGVALAAARLPPGRKSRSDTRPGLASTLATATIYFASHTWETMVTGWKLKHAAANANAT